MDSLTVAASPLCNLRPQPTIGFRMNILLTGANGFIGRYLSAALVTAGHSVTQAVRRPAEADWSLPMRKSIAVDFNQDLRPQDWLPRLTGIDAVVNCAGILQARLGQSIEAIHSTAPKALFAACQNAGVKRVIQISAISAEPNAGTAYATTKHDADEFLTSTDLDWVILRPSLVYASGAFGGTALFRALAACPFMIPMVGDGAQRFQPIHIDDLTATVIHILQQPAPHRLAIEPVGPEMLTLRQILLDLRRWLGFSPAPVLEVSMPIVRWCARVGDWIGGTVNTTALRQLAFGNIGSVENFTKATGIRPRKWSDALSAHPAQAQDRWHARLYFVRPLLRWALAAMWIGSGLVGLSQPLTYSARMMRFAGLPDAALPFIVRGSCLLDIVIGVALVMRWRLRALTLAQTAVVIIYTIGLSVANPSLWLDPFGPLLKNVPILVAILAWAAIENDR